MIDLTEEPTAGTLSAGRKNEAREVNELGILKPMLSLAL